MEILEKVELLPQKPGIYLFKDERGQILYIGKAKDIRKRVRSYFQGPKDAKTSIMLSKIRDVEPIVTHNEKEALILEDALIKQHKPPYNIKLKDDKNYPFLRLDPNEAFPRLQVVRRPKDDGAFYFGPFPSSQSLKETLKVLGSVFSLRKCSNSQMAHRSRPCLNYQMKRCLGPCCNQVDPEEYRSLVEQVKRFLQGGAEEVMKELERKMYEKAESLDFEEAALLRDRLQALRKVLEPQKIVLLDRSNKDVIAFERNGERVRFFLLSIRGGKLLSGKGFEFKDVGLPEEEVLLSFLSQYYQGQGFKASNEVIVPFELEDASMLESLGIRVHPPLDERERELLEMAFENLRLRTESTHSVLEELRRRFRLKKVPYHIEAFDISELSGKEAVGSMVVFLEGKPSKNQWRRFRIKEVKGIDDYGMLEEVLRRRLLRAKEEGVFPDLLLIDGGKGHLKVALKVLKEMELEGIDCLSIAKAREGEKEDKVYLPHARDPIPLREGKRWALFLKQIRDEAHRFALSYHHKLREKGLFEGIKIPGLGQKKLQMLLEKFGGLENLKKVRPSDLLALPGIGPVLAQRICEYFSQKEVKNESQSGKFRS